MGTGSFPGIKTGRGVTLPVPWSRKSRAIPLLPLWAVRPIQSLSACTRVHVLPIIWKYCIPIANTKRLMLCVLLRIVKKKTSKDTYRNAECLVMLKQLVHMVTAVLYGVKWTHDVDVVFKCATLELLTGF